MTPREFKRRYGQAWAAFARALDQLELGKKKRNAEAGQGLPLFAVQYRQVCHHLALARDRNYPHFLVSELQALVDRGHRALYQTKTRFLADIWQYLAADFPAMVRADKHLLLLSLALFAVPLLGFMLACWLSPEVVYSVFAPQQVVEFEQMYNPASKVIGRERSADNDFLMFGFYVRNNIGVSFQVFAGGLAAGLGSAFFLLFNGVTIGAVAGYLTAIGSGETFWQFVCGHGAFELTAIVISGVAGLKLGVAILSPGQRSRRDALNHAAREAVKIIYGVMLMLVIAAVLEAFWSSARWLAPSVKYAVAAILWTMVFYYFTFQGRPKRGGVMHAT